MNSLKIHIAIFIILLFSLSKASIAQDPMFNHYTEDRELPSNEVYGLALDKNNVIHMVTDRGLVVFDGYEFKHFSTNDSLEDNCILRINKDKDDRLWLTTLQNTANYIENGRIRTAGFSKALAALPKSNEDFVQHIFINAAGDTLITFNFPGIFRATASGDLERVSDHIRDAGDANICIFQTDEGFYWDLIRIPDNDVVKKSTLVRKGNRLFLSTSVGYGNPYQRKELSLVSKNEFYFSYCNTLFHILNDSIVGEYSFDNDILNILYDEENNDLWLGIDNSGAYRYPDCRLEDNPRIYLKGQGVSSIIIDHEKNYWFSVRDNGVYRANSLDNVVYKNNTTDPKDNRITALLPLNNQLLFGTSNGKLFSIQKDQDGIYDVRPYHQFTTAGMIRKLYKTKQNTILILSRSLEEIDLTGKLVGFKKINSYAYYFLELNGDTCLLSHSGGLRIFKNREKIYDLMDHPGYLRVKNMYKESPDKIWLSSQSNGVFLWDGKNDPVKFDAFPECGIYRSNAFGVFNGASLLSPYGYGLKILTGSDTLSILEQNDDLAGNMIDDLLVEKGQSGQDSLIWAASNKGITLLSFPYGLSHKPKPTKINTASGMPSNRIIQFAAFDGFVWAGTGAGLVRLNKSITPGLPLQKPVINQVFINDIHETYQSDSTLIVKAGYPLTNTIRFNFKTISYHEPHKVYYYYFMEGVDDQNENWAMTTDLEVRYTNLKSGTYTLFIHAARSPNLMIKGLPDHMVSTSKMNLVIHPNFYETLFFKLLTILIGLLGILLITGKIIKAVKNREENKQRLLQAERQALLSQMNPHFIFNSLNSIQHYIMEQDAENANLYLARFSQLIRRILDNSKKKWISLREEIETITLYLNLEKLRFEDNFEFIIVPDKQLDQLETMIPPMMVQPFVENAIWHGIMPLKEKGFVTIRYQSDKNRIKVVIEDNGIGREKASKRKRITGHTPTGLRNVNERIILLNKMMKEPISCNIIDRKHKNGKSAGTLVELSVPIMHLNS